MNFVRRNASIRDGEGVYIDIKRVLYSTGGYAALITQVSQWVGINQALVGATVVFIFLALLAILVYRILESDVVTLLIIVPYPLIIALLGLIPIGLGFVFTVLVAILGGAYIWWKKPLF